MNRRAPAVACLRRAAAALCLVVAAAAVGPVSAGPAATARPAAAEGAANFDLVELAPGVHAAIRRDPPGLMCDANSVLVINDEDVVVIDAPVSSRAVIAALQRLTPKPVRYVINTHWHDDHVMGNQAWRDAYPGCEFIALQATRDYLPGAGAKNRQGMIEGAPGYADYIRGEVAKGRNLAGGPLTGEERASYASDLALVDQYMAVVPQAQVVLPDITVTDSLTLHRGARTVEIRRIGAGHTAGDLVVRLPQENLVFAGDLVVWPVPLVGDPQSHVTTWADALDRLRALSPSAIVPGHGPVLRGDAYLRQLARLFRAVTDQVRAALAATPGRPLEEVRKAVDLAALREEFAAGSSVRAALFDRYVAEPAVAAAYRELSTAP